jgi:hypothetical protein
LIDALSFCTCHARQTAPRGACPDNGRFVGSILIDKL